MNKEYRDYLKSDAWAEIRTALFLSRGKKCERCPNTKRLHIHHKTYERIFHEDPADLEILCCTCHKKEHGKIKKKKSAKKRTRRFKVNVKKIKPKKMSWKQIIKAVNK